MGPAGWGAGARAEEGRGGVSALTPTAAAPTAGAARPRARRVTRGAGPAPRRPGGRGPRGRPGAAGGGALPLRAAPAVTPTPGAARAGRRPAEEVTAGGCVCGALPEEREGLWRVTTPLSRRDCERLLLQLTQRLRGAPDVWPLSHRQRNQAQGSCGLVKVTQLEQEREPSPPLPTENSGLREKWKTENEGNKPN